MASANTRKFALDSSVVVAALSSWHENHEQAARAIDAKLKAGWTPLIPANVLLETFAVLTRLPSPFRVPVKVALAAIEGFYPDYASEITAGDCFEAMRKVGQASLAGGKVYDAAIAACAARGAVVLLTFNASDFLRVRRPGLAIEAPE